MNSVSGRKKEERALTHHSPQLPNCLASLIARSTSARSPADFL